MRNSALRGSNVDARQVSLFADPTSSVIVAADSGEVVDGIDVGRAEGGFTGVGVRSHQSDESSATAAPPVVGFAGGPDPDGYVLEAFGSHEVSVADDGDIVIPGSSLKNYVKSWYWKFRLPDSKESQAFSSDWRNNADFWIYARRGDADGREGGTHAASLIDFTIRSRAWAGKAGDIRNLQDRAPFGSAPSCVSGGNLELAYGPFKVVIPQSACQTVKATTNNNSDRFEFGSDWDGSSMSPVSIEAIASFRVWGGKKPVFADYVWATFYVGPMGRRDVKWTDSGW